VVASTGRGLAGLHTLGRQQRALGLTVEDADRDRLRDLEPHLGPQVLAGARTLPGDVLRQPCG
jgi:hypothetical protein